MLPELATTADYNAIINTLGEYWGERDRRARHHPMFIHEFGETALVMRDGSGGVAAYLFGFVAPTQVGYVHLVGVRTDSRRAVAQVSQFANRRGHGACFPLRAVGSVGADDVAAPDEQRVDGCG